MKKSLFDLAIEYTGHDKNNLTEFQEDEIVAFVRFGERVIDNSTKPEAPAHAEQKRPACSNCGENNWKECIHGVFCVYCHMQLVNIW